MKNDLAYWEKNKEHLQKHFLDWEEFVAVDKLHTHLPWRVFILLIAVLSVGLVFVLLIRRPFTKIEVFFLSVWAGGMLLSVLMELFSWSANHEWIVLTTRGFYVCVGKDCELIFDRSFSSIEGISYRYSPGRILLNVYSGELPAKAESSYRGLPWKGQKAYIKNRFRKLWGTPLERKIFSLSVVSGITPIQHSRRQLCCYLLDLPKESEAAEKLLHLLKGFPGVRCMELTRESDYSFFDRL